MKRISKSWENVTIALIIVIINLIFVMQVGLAYARFDWASYASAYPYLLFLPFVSKPFAVTNVTASVFGKSSYSGPCPTVFTFSGNITANGAGTATYRWERSDSVYGSTQPITFTGPETKVVTSTWSIGAPGFVYNEWEKVHVLSPNDLTSNLATFSLTCSP